MNPLIDLTRRLVVAHRGASARAPENTVAAFELAVRLGADALELDVRLSADGIPIVLHDATLDRTTNGQGPSSGRPVAELQQLDAGARFSRDGGRTFPFRGQGIRIPTLADVLLAFPEMPMLVEIKEVRAQDAVRRVLLEQSAVERCVIASAHAAALELFREAPFLRGAAGEDIAQLYWGTAFGRVPRSVDYRLLSVPQRYRGLTVPTRRFLAAARRLGCPVHVWTVDTREAAQRLWTWGVAGIVTNTPEVIIAARDAFGIHGRRAASN
jgi:glycerophosphoryl diester phosphodiesterase